MILYGISSACTNTELLISMIYLPMKWEEQGLGISTDKLVTMSLFCFFPSVIILLFSDQFIPSRITIKNYIKGIIIIFSITVCMIPLLRDIIPENYVENFMVRIFQINK